MAAIGTESIPTTWTDERDTAFFRITASLFPGEFTDGGTVLLASYDDECAADKMSTTTSPSSERPTSTVPTPHISVR